MTIQRTVLFSLASLLLASSTTVNAQCRMRGVVIDVPSYSFHRTARIIPHLGHRPTVHLAAHTTYAQLPVIPNNISFGACSHIDDLANRLEYLLNELCLDLYYNYSHNPDFIATYSEAYSLFQTARFIHASEHNFDRDAIRQQLGGADALFHHIQDDVRGWTRAPRRQIGTLGIVTKLAMTEETLHHLMEDLGVTATPGLEEPPTPDQINVPPAPQVLSIAPEPPVLP